MPRNRIIKKVFSPSEMIHSFVFSLFCSASTQSLNKTYSNLKELQIRELETNNSWHIIDLSHNSIEFIDVPDGLLRNQTHLETLRLDFNPLKGRENEQILRHNTLKNFECNSCGFERVENQHFAGLNALAELRLRANKIKWIDDNAFKSNGNLKLLDLSENQLKEMPYSMFVDFQNFEDLSLSSNAIQLPKNRAFVESKSMKRLRLDGCNLTTIYQETFTKLCKLEALNLSQNQIDLLPVNSFKQNSELKSLFVEGNRLRFFPITILDLPRISELCIDNNDYNDNQDFAKLVQKYGEKNLRTDSCSNNNAEYFIENLFTKAVNDVPPSVVVVVIPVDSSEKTSKFVKNFLHGGISNFYISSYISFIIVLQVAAFVLLTIYLIKITRYEKLDGAVNYANSILNDDEIYRAYKSNE